MTVIRAFNAVRPSRELASKVAELPYDVVDSDEARAMAEGNEYNFFHVTKPEIDLDPSIDLYDDRVYAKGRENFEDFIRKGILAQEAEPCLYLYSLTMDGRTQTGLVAAVSVDDYLENRVKKHELTREDKEKDRTRHVDTVSADTGPVFLFYRENGSRRDFFNQAMKLEPEYDFTAVDGIHHTVRVIRDRKLIAAIEESFSGDILYIADGHHRAASAARVCRDRRAADHGFTGKESYNFFLAVIFPHEELKIMAYNRAVKDLNGNDEKSFMEKLGKSFDIEPGNMKVPAAKGQVSMYMKGQWHTLSPKFRIPSDPIMSLDVNLLQEKVLSPILGIGDPRKDNRIQFIGGIRGTEELERLVDSGKHTVAFSMYPTSIDELMAVADVDGIMPPKSTWFEPKLRDGLLVHKI
jgi:uncharacterized protein (DUF1015 family)